MGPVLRQLYEVSWQRFTAIYEPLREGHELEAMVATCQEELGPFMARLDSSLEAKLCVLLAALMPEEDCCFVPCLFGLTALGRKINELTSGASEEVFAHTVNKFLFPQAVVHSNLEATFGLLDFMCRYGVPTSSLQDFAEKWPTEYQEEDPLMVALKEGFTPLGSLT